MTLMSFPPTSTFGVIPPPKNNLPATVTPETQYSVAVHGCDSVFASLPTYAHLLCTSHGFFLPHMVSLKHNFLIRQR
jgi:hypothetical protein